MAAPRQDDRPRPAPRRAYCERPPPRKKSPAGLTLGLKVDRLDATTIGGKSSQPAPGMEDEPARERRRLLLARRKFLLACIRYKWLSVERATASLLRDIEREAT